MDYSNSSKSDRADAKANVELASTSNEPQDSLRDGATEPIEEDDSPDHANAATDNSKLSIAGTTNLLTSTSILTFIANETPALRAHLSDENITELNNFVKEKLESAERLDCALLGHFLFGNALSIAAKFFIPVLEAAISKPEYVAIQKMQLSIELDGLKKQKDIEVLIQEREEKMQAKLAKNGGIGVANGRPIFGPRKPEDMEDDWSDIPFAPTFALSQPGLEDIRRIMAKK